MALAPCPTCRRPLRTGTGACPFCRATRRALAGIAALGVSMGSASAVPPPPPAPPAVEREGPPQG